MLDLRNHFYLPPATEAIEFRAFTHGLMPKTVPTMMQAFVADWQQYGVDAWNQVPNHWLPDSGDVVGWWTLPAYLGDKFIAPLLGTPAGTCIMQPNVHWVVQCLLSSRELFHSRKRVVITEAAFPSVRFSLLQWADVFGLEVINLPLNNGTVPQTDVLRAIDENTALVFLSHVGFITGERLTDAFLHELALRCRTNEVISAVDGYHSIGAITSSVADLGVDFYFGGLLKEGSGSSGNAYLYTRPGTELSPRLSGWFGDADPFGFNDAPQKHPDLRSRFLGGTTAIASLYHSVEGIRLLLDAGLPGVRQDSLNKTARCIEWIDALGLQLRSPRKDEQRSAMIVLALERADLMVSYLKKQQIYMDSRQGKFLRLAPFVWNTMEEIDRAFEVLKKGLHRQSYLNTQPKSTAGPVT